MIVAPEARPPLLMFSIPPLLMTVALAIPPLLMFWVPPERMEEIAKAALPTAWVAPVLTVVEVKIGRAHV